MYMSNVRPSPVVSRHSVRSAGRKLDSQANPAHPEDSWHCGWTKHFIMVIRGDVHHLCYLMMILQMVYEFIWSLPKLGVPPVTIHFSRIFHCKGSSYWVSPCREPPHICKSCGLFSFTGTAWPTTSCELVSSDRSEKPWISPCCHT